MTPAPWRRRARAAAGVPAKDIGNHHRSGRWNVLVRFWMCLGCADRRARQIVHRFEASVHAPLWYLPRNKAEPNGIESGGRYLSYLITSYLIIWYTWTLLQFFERRGIQQGSV